MPDNTKQIVLEFIDLVNIKEEYRSKTYLEIMDILDKYIDKEYNHWVN